MKGKNIFKEIYENIIKFLIQGQCNDRMKCL